MLVETPRGKLKIQLTDEQLGVLLLAIRRAASHWDIISSEEDREQVPTQSVDQLVLALCTQIRCNGGGIFPGRGK